MLLLPAATPVTPVSYSGLSFALKRDDLIHPFISGNKWRKLKYALHEMQQAGKTHLVTFGGAYSNHVLACAAACAAAGLRCTAFIRGEEVENDTLFLCRMYSAQLIFISRDAYRNKQQVYGQYFGNNADSWFINEGGSGPAGVMGCAEIIGELTQPYDYIFCACGTGTTALGLLQGIIQHNLPAKLVALGVLKGNTEVAHMLQQADPQQKHHIYTEEYAFGGYAKTTPALLHFCHNFTAATGILTDPVYTGKMLFGLCDMGVNHHGFKNKKLLGLHTGGQLGLLGYKQQLAKIL